MTALVWVQRTCAAIDEAIAAGADVLMAAHFADDRPVRGLLALADWRSAGWLSEEQARDRLAGGVAERTLLPARGAFAVARLVAFGLGARASFDPRIAEATVDAMLEVAEQLGAQRPLIELPGRASGELPPNDAIELLRRRLEARDFAADRIGIVDPTDLTKSLGSPARPRAVR
jgi:hypothetical protein